MADPAAPAEKFSLDALAAYMDDLLYRVQPCPGKSDGSVICYFEPREWMVIESVAATLKFCRDHQDAIRAAVAGKRGRR